MYLRHRQMRIHIIKWKSIEIFCEKHARSKVSFYFFKEAINRANWDSINDIRKTFRSADLIDNKRIVFNIGGNNYRLICTIWFGPKMVHLYIKWIGTHAEYSKLCKQKLQFTIDVFK